MGGMNTITYHVIKLTLIAGNSSFWSWTNLQRIF